MFKMEDSTQVVKTIVTLPAFLDSYQYCHPILKQRDTDNDTNSLILGCGLHVTE